MLENSYNRLKSIDLSAINNVIRNRPYRLIFTLILVLVTLNSGELGQITRISIYDAYTQVSVFVAVTLLLFFGLEYFLKFDISNFLKNGGIWQVPTASVLGALPGCGGAVVAITAFARGNITLGSMVGALIATMGDAAFLLIAKEPLTYLKVITISTSAAIIFGWLVDRFHPGELYNLDINKIQLKIIGRLRKRDIVYMILIIPGLILGLLQLMQISTSHYSLLIYIGIAGALASTITWAMSPVNAVTDHSDHPFSRTTEETSFVTVWVITAYLAYEYSFVYLGLNLDSIVDSAIIIIPLLAILIGFIPGCGPQIIITTLYINGVIPFAALIGNSISNDGDALFPAIALTPRMAIIATLYSAIPALIISYIFLFTS